MGHPVPPTAERPSAVPSFAIIQDVTPESLGSFHGPHGTPPAPRDAIISVAGYLERSAPWAQE
jgi:hypothetical protein